MRHHLRGSGRVGVPRTEDVIAPEPTRVLLALMTIHGRWGRVTLDDLAVELGQPRMTIYRHLRDLRDLDLIAMGKAGATRPLVTVAPMPDCWEMR